MTKKFKVGELCLIAAAVTPVDPRVAVYLGETVEVVRVSTWLSPIRSNGEKWDYLIAHADGRRLVCMEPALRKRPPPNTPGFMDALTFTTGWAPKKRQKADA